MSRRVVYAALARSRRGCRTLALPCAAAVADARIGIATGLNDGRRRRSAAALRRRSETASGEIAESRLRGCRRMRRRGDR